MNRFYVGDDAFVNDRTQIIMSNGDVGHVRDVLRMKVGDVLVACDGRCHDYHCRIVSIAGDVITLGIDRVTDSTSELPVEVSLYQGFPKNDKMELVIQKCVELGVYEIIPVLTRRTVVRMDDGKREVKKLKRLRAISEAAAKQSDRGMVPSVGSMMDFKDAISKAVDRHDLVLLPYELATDMDKTREVIGTIAQFRQVLNAKERGLVRDKGSVGVFIGPEGGFDDEEVEYAKGKGVHVITLGSRILRTETAGMVALSYINYIL